MFYKLWIMLGLFFSFSLNATSLFDSANFQPLTADKRAYREGDTLTILIVENAQAKTSAGASLDKDLAISASGSSPNGTWPFGIGIDSATSGDAAVHRNGYLRAQLTAVVIKKDNNGNLMVKGTQRITLDGESQSIEITGMVRQSDISSENTIVSNRLFDANISFIGSGDTREAQERGIVARVLGWLGLL